jgi:guanylate kinase
LELDINGANNIFKSSMAANYIGILPPDMETLKNRLIGRGTEKPEVINKRIDEGVREVEEIKKSEIFNYKIVNNDLTVAYREFKDGILNLYPHLNYKNNLI